MYLSVLQLPRHILLTLLYEHRIRKPKKFKVLSLASKVVPIGLSRLPCLGSNSLSDLHAGRRCTYHQRWGIFLRSWGRSRLFESGTHSCSESYGSQTKPLHSNGNHQDCPATPNCTLSATKQRQQECDKTLDRGTLGGLGTKEHCSRRHLSGTAPNCASKGSSKPE